MSELTPKPVNTNPDPAAAAISRAGQGVALVAAWPGMGNVGVIAAATLIHELKMTPVGEVPLDGYFDVDHVPIADGVISAPRMPRSMLYRWDDPAGNNRLFVFLAEAQPTRDAMGFARAVLARASELKVDRVYTFASLATNVHPAADASVGGAATDTPTLERLRRLELNILGEGQISGMNGLLLGAAAQAGVPGACLLGEVPSFATGAPAPKAAKGILEAFGVLENIQVNLRPLTRHARLVEKALLDVLDKARPALASEQESDEAETDEGDGTPIDASAEAKLDDASIRIEELFAKAGQDRSQVPALKAELDRLNLFHRYENRFLDLFRRAA